MTFAAVRKTSAAVVRTLARLRQEEKGAVTGERPWRDSGRPRVVPLDPFSVPGAPRTTADIDVELRGSTAVVTGVVERVEERRRIADAIGSLEFVTEVENNLRPPAP